MAIQASCLVNKINIIGKFQNRDGWVVFKPQVWHSIASDYIACVTTHGVEG